MHISTVSAASALFAASFVAAAPAVGAGEKFTVNQIKNENFKGKNGAIAYARAFTKFGVEVPSDVASAAAAAETGSVTATPLSDDSEYIEVVQIGTPAQNIPLDFDTGSADLWVFSTQTPSSEVEGQTLYEISASSTAKKLTGYTWSISYGDGSSSSGDVYTDVVKVGGVTVTTQAVESAETVSSEFSSDASSSGLLGLAFSSINTVSPTAQNTFFDNAKASLALPLFTSDLKAGEPGTYDFGYIDSSKYTGAISYTAISSRKGFWEFTGTGYAVGSGAFVTESIDAIADTGTTLLYLPTDIVTAYYAEVSGSAYSALFGGYVFPCTATLPSFTFGAGTYKGTIPGSYLNYAAASGSKCYGGIQRNTGIGFSIYGDMVLKSQFVVWDSGNSRIGFAAKPL